MGIAYGSKHVAEGTAQIVSAIGLHQSPSKEAQNKHTQRPALDNIRAGFNKVHKQQIQREVLAGTNPAEVNSTPCGQLLHSSLHTMVGVYPLTQPA